MPKTKRERVIHAITQRGSVELPSTSKKYRRFTVTTTSDKFYFVGKAGALRVGACASKSVSLESVVPQLLAKWPV